MFFLDDSNVESECNNCGRPANILVSIAKEKPKQKPTDWIEMEIIRAYKLYLCNKCGHYLYLSLQGEYGGDDD